MVSQNPPTKLQNHRHCEKYTNQFVLNDSDIINNSVLCMHACACVWVCLCDPSGSQPKHVVRCCKLYERAALLTTMNKSHHNPMGHRCHVFDHVIPFWNCVVCFSNVFIVFIQCFMSLWTLWSCICMAPTKHLKSQRAMQTSWFVD